MDKILKLKAVYKSKLGSIIKFKRSLQEISFRLEKLVVPEQLHNVESTSASALKAKEEVERVLASERSSWDADRAIIQSTLDMPRQETN